MRELIRQAALPVLMAAAIGSLSQSVVAQGYCSPGLTCLTIGAGRELTPEERAEQARRDAEARARAAEFKRKVDAMVGTMGEHRRAEAENYVRMQEAAAAARPNYPAPTPAPAKARNCKPTKTVWTDGRESSKSMAEAQARTQAARAHTCKDGKVCGETTCSETKAVNKTIGKVVMSAPGSFACGFKVTHERTVCDMSVSAQ